ncbi:hypothetical protein [Dyadobacter sp. Leaf189]|uniref:hypothetical protein n=1 Tax=Dyadobacter sp. Leaf189 TaxID=1736295 RepID=UPI0006FC6238|nr:hypothetical protein [Dyadobacter sp. Leaf189]KQS28052.1 hypothetical protein ASG33_16830 [Dyadobacter sp. Leaf189]
MKKISLQFAALLTMLFLFSFSCEDHVVPQTPEIVPVLSTLPMDISAGGKLNLRMAFQNLGNVQITSYGIAYSPAFYDLSLSYSEMPTIDYEKQEFTGSPALGNLSNSAATAPKGFFALYYRAYAMLGNGKTVYGNVMKYSPDLGGKAVVEVFGSPELNKPYNTGYIVKDIGSKVILEYGLVYSYNVAANQAINPAPTVADHKNATMANILAPKNEMLLGVKLAITEPALNEMYIRSYVIYADQTVDYGKFTLHVKK